MFGEEGGVVKGEESCRVVKGEGSSVIQFSEEQCRGQGWCRVCSTLQGAGGVQGSGDQ